MAGLDAKGATIDDFRDPYGVSGTLPGPVPRPPARGRAVPELRRPGAQAARRPGGGPTCASAASRARARKRGRLGRGGELREAAGAVERDELLVAADASRRR